ncbi:hypothetical protein ACFQY0_13545 [Haloferula chungangensis]|uniref:YtxH domain-containing protein n=1 Tax=Haloferula chungangensis TaxID=1048331 RepID=A0ABW2L955_9BACT
MKLPLIISTIAAAFTLVACDSPAENRREDALENKADSMEDAADKARDSGERAADSAEDMGADGTADNIRERTERAADQLEDEADATRDQK